MASDRAAFLTPGRRTVCGYLLVVRGPRKRDYGLFGNLVADAAEQSGATLPRYQDCHAVWYGRDATKPPGHQMIAPLLRYRQSRPIPGLDRACSGHRVEVTCTVGEPWSNGYGAPITRASGRCLDCQEARRGE